MVNNCTFVGRLAKDPEIKSTQSGVHYANFTLAIERSYAAEGKERETDWIDCRAWRTSADFIGKYFRKGSWISVEGEMQTSNYEAQDGTKRKLTYCQVRQAGFVGAKQSTEGEKQGAAAPVEGFSAIDDDVPF